MVAHERSVKGMVYEPSGEHLLTVGDDKTIKIWKSFKEDEDEAVMPTNTIICKVFTKKNPLLLQNLFFKIFRTRLLQSLIIDQIQLL
jgi:WD40 repeat protein